MRKLKAFMWAAALIALCFEGAAVGYFWGQNSVEPVQIPVFVDVEVPEKFEKTLRLAVYLDGHIEQLAPGQEPNPEGLEFIVTLEYTPVPGLGSESLTCWMLFSDGGMRSVDLTVPGGKFRYSIERKGPEPNPSEDSGEGF